MEQQISQQIEQQLRGNWQQVSQQILTAFTQVSRADVDSATTADDLVKRISDKTHYTERYVETRLTELVGAGGGGQSFSQQSFGSSSQQSRS